MIVRDGDHFRIQGAVTLENVSALLAEAAPLMQGDRVVVDFADVAEVDSAAISLMLEWTRRFKAEGRQIAFANLGDNLASLAALYGVGELIPLAK
jgi:phospholipid transport system transporter-binding protein